MAAAPAAWRAVRGSAAAGIREPGAHAQSGADAHESGARITVVQHDPAQLSVLGGDSSVLSLARRAHSQAHTDCGVRVGNRVLHQPDVTRGSHRGFAQRALTFLTITKAC